MRLSALTVTATLLTAACATGPQARVEDRTLPFGCNDVVVIGRVQSGAYEPVQDDSDILGHGWVSATLTVSRIVKGASVPSVLSVRYFAHAYMRQDRDFMLVLKRTTSGGYQIATGQLMWLRPRLASRCQ